MYRQTHVYSLLVCSFLIPSWKISSARKCKQFLRQMPLVQPEFQLPYVPAEQEANHCKCDAWDISAFCGKATMRSLVEVVRGYVFDVERTGKGFTGKHESKYRNWSHETYQETGLLPIMHLAFPVCFLLSNLLGKNIGAQKIIVTPC